jgi:glycerophosphoryl diester phosphodiesterase
VLVIAHRGASAELPENTLAAFERAIEIGADFVEFDVWNAAEVTHDPPQAGVPYPRLAEVVELCRGRIGLMVELKRPRGDTVARALRMLDDEDIVVSFQRRAIVETQKLRPKMRTVQHVGFGTSIRSAQGGWAVGFQNQRATRRGIATAQALGLETTVYTVNDVARMLELRDLGVTGVFTDDPRQALAALRNGV